MKRRRTPALLVTGGLVALLTVTGVSIAAADPGPGPGPAPSTGASADPAAPVETAPAPGSSAPGSSASAATGTPVDPAAAAPTPTAAAAGIAPPASSLDPAGGPGPATGAPAVAPPAHVVAAGRPLHVAAPASAEVVDPTALAARGTLAEPATAPLSTGWITSTAWNTAPSAHQRTPPLPLFARDVPIDGPVRSAILTIAGLGLYSPSVNGRPASSAVLQPGASDFARSVEYRSYQVGGLLGPGVNRLGVALGTGIYDEVATRGRYAKLTHIGGPLGFTARLDVTLMDGGTRTFDTSSDWWTRPSGTTTSDWYGGEDHDARVEPGGWDEAGDPLARSSGWTPAVVADIAPRLALYPQRDPPVVALPPVGARSVRRLPSGDQVVDFGRYVTGQPRLRLAAPRGTVVRLYPAERLRRGVPDQSTATGGKPAPIYDRYTFAGHGTETWQPRFVYHGFRYLRVTGLSGATLTVPEVSAAPVRTVLPAAGSVRTSSPLLNAVVRLTDTSVDANLQGLLTDCPNREKLGWTEQDSLLFELLSGRYDVSAYAPNTVRLMAEAQRVDGSVPEISPEVVRFHPPFDGDVDWGGALVLLPWQLYRAYGDTDTMARYYHPMTRYVGWLRSHAHHDLLISGLGDWITPAPGARRGATTSMGYYQVVSTVAKEADVLGMPADAGRYRALAVRIKAAINRAYYRGGMYGSEQATNAMALALGLAPDVRAVRGSLIALVESSGDRFETGEIGLSFLFTALHDMGRDDLLWSAIGKPDAPGFASFVRTGAPALPEYWSGMGGTGSLAHLMLGSPAQWAQNGLGGIAQTDDSVGYRHLLLRPAVFTGPARVTASRGTPQGTVVVAWRRSGTAAHVTVTVPAGAQARVVLPTGTHEVSSGTWAFDTALGRRSDFGARPFVVPVGRIVRIPWSGSRWGAVGGTQRRLTDAQWQATGYRRSVTGLPAGAVVARAVGGRGRLAWTPDGRVHRLTQREWRAIGRPRTTRVPVLAARYAWSSTVWLISEWRRDRSTWSARRAVRADLVALHHPLPARTVVIPGSLPVRHAGSPVISLLDPAGTAHVLTRPEWDALGDPAPVVSA